MPSRRACGDQEMLAMDGGARRVAQERAGEVTRRSLVGGAGADAPAGVVPTWPLLSNQSCKLQRPIQSRLSCKKPW